MIRFTVTGEPVPKQSFRFARAGSYQPARVKDWQAAVGWAAKQAMKGCPPVEGEVSAWCWFRVGNRRRVDLDNLWKAVGDAIEGIAYLNDSQVVQLVLRKNLAMPGELPPGVTVEVEGCAS